MRALYLALVGINAWFFAAALWNVVYLRRATHKSRIRSGSFVSVIVPARDEEGPIARCLESLLAQDYADYEVIVVDDDSDDLTAETVSALAAHEPRLRLVAGAELPDGWLGKPHALSQGAAVAHGEILLLTDADTVHAPDSISWAVTNLQDHDADVLSGYLRQEYSSLGERLVVPTMYAMMLLVPFSLVARTKSPALAFAIGQYVAMRREALDDVGGFESIRDSIVDDMSMAARMKAFGHRNVFLDAKQAARCHLYSGYRDAFAGIERSVYSSVGGHPATIAGLTVIVLGLICAPALYVLASLARFDVPSGPVAISAALFAAQWAVITWDRDIPLVAFVFYPLVFFNLLIIAIASMLSTGFGRGVQWKGRLVHIAQRPGVACEPEIADCPSSSDRIAP